HVNTPAEWAELVAGLERLDLALPGGLYGLHIHNGLASRRADHGLDVDDDRFARLTKVYEAYWRALSGLGYRAPREPVTGQRGQIDYLPLEALIPGRGGLYARDHGVAINLHPDFPTIETRILSGLLERDPAGAERLNAERLAADVWWSFALARAAAGEDHFELATLGVPVTAGMRPSLKQILHFADRVYREDATGKALAIQKLLERYGEDEGLPDDRLAEEDARIRALYRRLGLGTVYELHSGHDGIDENLLEHLRSPGRFSALVRDLSLAHAEDASALALFPASLRPELARALRQERREEPLWRRALGAVKRAF
ncbi:MAG: hypothetical protein HY553_04175, partial [Elusimicrobia bacterium]|nr:hypothetical protein [Elusimicrobiota bacterium]